MSASSSSSPLSQQILHKRIGFALRRFTGVAYDVDQMLARPELRARRVALWRAAGCGELNELLNELEHRACLEGRVAC